MKISGKFGRPSMVRPSFMPLPVRLIMAEMPISHSSWLGRPWDRGSRALPGAPLAPGAGAAAPPFFQAKDPPPAPPPKPPPPPAPPPKPARFAVSFLDLAMVSWRFFSYSYSSFCFFACCSASHFLAASSRLALLASSTAFLSRSLFSACSFASPSAFWRASSSAARILLILSASSAFAESSSPFTDSTSSLSSSFAAAGPGAGLAFAGNLEEKAIAVEDVVRQRPSAPVDGSAGPAHA
mmetsp:Transcript_68864/g.156046  ORF Transcript_68864/g.156046 Transcript_68864/m.156046 type:complete len:239 (+) Transcript_68864:329-1045(+)